MTPLVEITGNPPTGWLTVDLLEVDGVNAAVVVPTFGRRHHCGADCWCHPDVLNGGRLFVHYVEH